MTYLIKIILINLFAITIALADDSKNKIIFKINEKVFTDIDIERRINYINITKKNRPPNRLVQPPRGPVRRAPNSP